METSSGGEEPQPNPTGEAASGEQPEQQQQPQDDVISSPEDFINMDDLDGEIDIDAIESALSGELPEPAGTAPEKPEEAEDDKPDQNPDAEAKEEETEEPESQPGSEDKPKTADSDGGKSGPERISLKHLSDEDRRALATANSAVRDGTYATLPEALAAMKLVDSPAPTAKSEGEDEKPEAEKGGKEPDEDQDPPEKPEAVSAIETEIESLEADLAEATESYDTKQIIELGRQIRGKQLDLVRAEQEAKEAQKAADQEKQTKEEYAQAYDSTWKQQLESNPDLHDSESDLYRKVLDKRDLLDLRAGRGDAKAQQVLGNPAHLATLVEEAKQELGLAQKATDNPNPSQQARPVGKVAPGSQSRGVGAVPDLDKAADELVDEESGDTSALEDALSRMP